ncbi:hypothetical protein QYF36_006655 [Acer negundo]|nr:hypothetical protein QYF36_006655 [Acer negundo]
MSNEKVDYEEEPLSPAARTLLHGHRLKLNCHIISIFGFKTSLNPSVFKQGLENTLIKHPRFSSKLVINDKKGGEMKWVETRVNIEEHVIVPDIDPKMENPDEFVQDYISNITTMAMDISRPLWAFHLLNVKTSEAEAIAVLCVHHSLGDGASLMSLLLSCCRKASNPEALPSVPMQRKYCNGEDSSSVSKGFWWWFLGIWSAIVLIWNTIMDVMVFMATIMFLKDTKSPLKTEPGGVDEHVPTPRHIVHRTISLDDIKLVKKAMNMTINDVVLGASQAGLSRYLNRSQGKTLAKSIRFRAVVVVNLRPTKGIQGLANMMAKGSKVKWGNMMGYILLPFKVASQNDPLDYIRQAKTTIDRKKLSLGALCTFSIASFACKTFGVKAAAFIAHRVFAHTTTAFSNVVGPIEEITFYGHPIAFIAPSVYGVDQALTIHFLSYVNKMSIVLGVNPNVIPNPHQLCDDIEESLKIIKDAIIQTGSIKKLI